MIEERQATAARTNGVRLAVTTFTVWPFRGPGQVDRRSAGVAMRLAPLASLLVSVPAAALLVLTWALMTRGGTGYQVPSERVQAPYDSHALASGVAAVLAIGLTAALTRGLHLDGLADTVDGLGSYRSPEKALELMRRGGSGPLGITALLANLLLQISALAVVTDISPTFGAVALVVAHAIGRTAVTLACTPRTPAARPDGLGAMVAGTVTRLWALGITTVVVALSAAAVYVPEAVLGTTQRQHASTEVSSVGETFYPRNPPHLVQEAAILVVAGVVALALTHLLRSHCVRRFGGMTGDVLGALVEVSVVVVLLGTALAAPSFSSFS